MLHGRAAARRMRRRPGAAGAGSSTASTSRNGTTIASCQSPKLCLFFRFPFLLFALTLASVLGCAAVEDDAESDDEEVPEGRNVPRSSKKEKKRQEREMQRQVGNAKSCHKFQPVLTLASLLLNRFPMIAAIFGCNFSCTSRFSLSTVCILVC